MSASLNTSEPAGGWQNHSDSQFTCNISDSHTLGSCWAVLLKGGGSPGVWGELGWGIMHEASCVCDSRVGQGPSSCASSISVRQGVSLGKAETYSSPAAVICVRRGVRSQHIDRADVPTAAIVIKMPILQKGWAGGGWSVSRQYRFCCCSPLTLWTTHIRTGLFHHSLVFGHFHPQQ